MSISSTGCGGRHIKIMNVILSGVKVSPVPNIPRCTACTPTIATLDKASPTIVEVKAGEGPDAIVNA